MARIEFVTTLGCTVSVAPFDDEKIRLCLDMKKPGDGRHTEVILTFNEREQLRAMLLAVA